jgi:multidrug resistance efflux pump
MPADLPPVEFTDDSLESFLSRHSRRSSAIYIALIVLVCAGFGLLPLVHVGVSVQAAGVIRPAVEVHEIVAGTAGYVERVTVRENERVQQGAEIVRIAAAPVESRRDILDDQLREMGSMIQDLEHLTGGGKRVDGTDWITSDRYQAEHRLYLQEMSEIDVRQEQANRQLLRTRELAELGLAPRSELEEREFAVDRIEAERISLARRYQSEWQSRIDQLNSQRLQLLERRSLLSGDSAHFIIRAPIEGTVGQMVSLSSGSFVTAGQLLAVVSPAAELVAEVFVSPSDFGLLEIGTPVRILIDAFNYSDWGFIPGAIAQMPDDYILLENRPVFRTVVKLETTELALRSGIRRRVTKGMTLRARFMVAERSLWQLLRDDINDWLNPLQRPA